MKEPYIPELDIVYPEKPDDRMVPIKGVRDFKLDENYPFVDKSFKAMFRRGVVYFTIYTLLRPLAFLRTGLRIEGRKFLRKHKKILKNGALTVCNHVHRWDLIMIAQGVRYHTLYFPVWLEPFKSPDAGLMRGAGGVPIPEELSLIKYFNKAFDELHEKKHWIHVFPESSRFNFFQPIRPFKKGAFTMAHRYNIPVVPMAFSYRKPRFPYTIVNGIRSLVGIQKKPMMTLRIGEPLLIDTTLSRKEAVAKMRKECHEAVVRLAGINENKYPAEGD
jgi:1-acyl-sn-glycerol-3-phosphate acyltransferase